MNSLLLDLGTTGVGWYVYILKASDERLYTGITMDMTRRWKEHSGSDQENSKSSGKGAKFFRGRRPQSLLFLIESLSRSTASKEEIAIKSLSRKDKLALIDSSTNKLSSFPEISRSCGTVL